MHPGCTYARGGQKYLQQPGARKFYGNPSGSPVDLWTHRLGHRLLDCCENHFVLSLLINEEGMSFSFLRVHQLAPDGNLEVAGDASVFFLHDLRVRELFFDQRGCSFGVLAIASATSVLNRHFYAAWHAEIPNVPYTSEGLWPTGRQAHEPRT
eukprot:gnl/TRDRNA2_/TRDRNA2_84321_c0_seq1.p1 gnl/TRDRNA2_/TRDRNA2_84321_c0~~gnl/TRDRNA2_/TRDRNA2_84321_c0_seq1.p1  ORF type:complete len:153 (-),score=1.35 gnl/TRDRNA2_/TRDRNA2_84321_c0_seq1:9-467(-)